MVVFDEEKQDKKLSELRKGQEESLAHSLARNFGVSYIDLTTASINSDALRIIPEEEARTAHVAVFDMVGKKIKIGALAPQSEATKTIVKKLSDEGYVPTEYMISIESLNKAWSRYSDLSYSLETKGGALDISSEKIASFLATVKSVEDVKKIIDTTVTQNKNYKISGLLEIVLAGALALNASDIHIEPEEEFVRIRFRLDGVLSDILHFESSTYRLLLSRIKLLSGMKLNLQGAQDGRFSIDIGDSEIEIRTSILPSAYSESIVMRILNPKSIAVPLEQLGIPPKLLEILLHEISKPEGMILTTGPTGSGKTTTLYAFLRKVFTPEIKVITIENPIEYHLQGIVQTQVNADKGYTFLEGLRSALRQDPDMIMVGEIRDEETAEIAINSALTGHLVFSTLHTNNAAGTFPRLIDLGINPKIITSALSVSMAQRLVRKLCTHCHTEVPIEGRAQEIITRILTTIKNKEQYIESIPAVIGEPKGCAQCNFTGYHGRVGLYEAILRTEAIEKAVKENPSEREIWRAASDQGILTMQQDGIIKILKKVTSLAELERVIDLENSWL